MKRPPLALWPGVWGPEDWREFVESYFTARDGWRARERGKLRRHAHSH